MVGTGSSRFLGKSEIQKIEGLLGEDKIVQGLGKYFSFGIL